MNRSFYSSLVLVLISFFLILAGCKKEEAPTAPQNHLPKIESLTANPATVLISTETTLTCIATDEDGDNLTITWSAQRGTFSNGVVGVAVKWVAPSTAGKDTITATVNDGKQTLQGKLEIIVGTIPTSPTLTAPTNNATEVDLSPTLTWSAVSNAVSYTLQVSTSNSFSSFVYNQSGLTNTSQQTSGLNIATTYYWRVNNTNVYGTSIWSNVFSFKTVAPPQTATLIYPPNAAQNISLTPTLSWNAVSNATSYTLQVSTTNSFSSFVYNQSGLTNTSQQITGLSNAIAYYWRVNAINTYGTSGWSSNWLFTTISKPCPGVPQVTYAGKAYYTVLIGNQCWLNENLNIGTMINTNLQQTNNSIIEKYCYNNDPNNCNTYGGLYQWNETMQYITTPGAKGLCPDGWHIPSKSEFETLAATVNNDGNALKAIGQGTGIGAGTNTSGFSALLGGFYSSNGNFTYLTGNADFWSSTDQIYNENTYEFFMDLSFGNNIIQFNGAARNAGISVRCIKD